MGRSQRAGGARLLTALVWLAVLAFAVSPAGAAEEEEREGFGGAFTVKASNGYSITALAIQRRSDGKGFLLLFVAREGSGVFYSTKANVTPDEIEADLGSLGKIDFDLLLSGKRKTERSSCDPEGIRFPAGSYRGTFEFRGEEGYTTASATRAPLRLKPFGGLICPGESGEGFGPSLPGARLRAFARGNANRLTLQVNANRPGARVFFEATTEELRDGIEIRRAVEGIAPRGAFRFDPLLRSATLSAPAPFSGSASFHRNASPPNRWTGNLTIDFPGRSDVALAGAAMRAGLARAHLDP